MCDFFDPPWPSTRHLTEQILSSSKTDSRKLTHMHMQWGQFLDHDIDLLGMFEVDCPKVNNDSQFCFPVKVKDTDKAFGITSKLETSHLRDHCQFAKHKLSMVQN